MRKPARSGIVFFLLSFTLALVCLSCIQEEKEDAKGSPPAAPAMEITQNPERIEGGAASETRAPDYATYAEAAAESPTKYLSSQICRRCHKDIYESWKNSMHHMALEDPIFQASFHKAYQRIGDGAETYCLKCHAPLASRVKPFDLANEAVKEGVTCDFCHSIEKVNLGSETPFVVSEGGVKMGPRAGMDSPFHETRKADHFQRSELCGGCHNLVNPNGVEVMGTYSEWKTSDQAGKGIQCQGCHMPVVKNGHAVVPHVKNSSLTMNTHYLQGGHSPEQLSKAVKVEIVEVRRLPLETIVRVSVSNFGAGHRIPTGTPSRYLKLEATAFLEEGREIAKKAIQYGKILVDRNGTVLKDDADLILRAAAVLSDNRIEPGETRLETFRFEIPERVKMKVKAELVYCYDPVIFVSQAMRLKMASHDVESK